MLTGPIIQGTVHAALAQGPDHLVVTLGALLGECADEVALADLAAEALEAITTSSLVAVVVDDGRIVAGQEGGVPITASRRRAVCSASIDPGEWSVHRLPGTTDVVVVMDADTVLAGWPAGAAATLIGAHFARLHGAREAQRLEALLRAQEAEAVAATTGRDLLRVGIDHLLHNRPADVEALLASVDWTGERADGDVVEPDWELVRLLQDASRVLQPRRTEASATEALLVMALLSCSGDQADELAMWSARVGRLDLRATMRAVVISRRPTEGGGSDGRATIDEAFGRRVREVLGEGGRSCPLVAVLDHSLVAVQVDEPVGDLLARWTRLAGAFEGEDVLIGIGSSGRWPNGLRQSLQQARWMSSVQRGDLPPTRLPDVAVFEHTGLIGEIVGLTHDQDLLGFARRVVEPLLADDRCGGELLETLHAYLSCGGSTGRAAEALHLHPSSVKYRLKVIRQLIGRERLEDADARFELEVAVRLMMASRQLRPRGQAA